MIESKLILDVFDLTFDECEHEDLLKKQVLFLTQSHQDHTGIGVFIYFNSENGIEVFQLPSDKEPSFDIKENLITQVDGVQLVNKNLHILADTIVHLKNGFIDCLEIWNKNGEDYPVQDPENYVLEQMWKGKGDKRKVTRDH